MIDETVDVNVYDLLEKNISGIMAQVTNPMYLSTDCPAKWRKLKRVYIKRINKVEYIMLEWEVLSNDSAYSGYTGVALKEDDNSHLKIQLSIKDYNTLFNE
jgi:hypothetical protein